jgi:hypothetical protein
MTKEDLARARQVTDASWELANDCLDILPASDLAVTGFALVHLVSIWLNAVPEEGRAEAYLKWLENLHTQLHVNRVLRVVAVTEALDETSGAVH